VEEGSSGNYVVASDQKYVWNDWLCLADLNATNNNVERSYLWGLDLSGSMQGAGGIGGLIAISDQPSSETHFVSYDGNGNVAALVSAADSSVTARYEYDPFGRTIRATGLMAAKNPMRFSTKRFDEAADLAYYGYRFYNLTTGRWLNRDPIGETSAGNLYGLLANLPVSGVDAFGLCKVCSSGVRYRVDIARLDSFQVVPPGQTGPYQAAANNLAGGLSFAYGIQGYPGIQTTIPTSSGPFSGVNPGNSWLPNEQRQAFQGDLHSVNFLFFADWEIDESDGVPCRLTMSEEGTVIRHYTDSSPDSTFRLHQDEHDISPTKSDRKPPLNGCCPKTLIFADAPGGYVLRAGGGGRGFGFDQTVNIVLKLYGSGVQPISTVSIAISMSVASDGTINSIHP
jgi:RHS repeat-associated protein